MCNTHAHKTCMWIIIYVYTIIYIICNHQFSFPLEALPPPCPASCLSHVLGLLATFFPLHNRDVLEKSRGYQWYPVQTQFANMAKHAIQKRKKHTKTKTWLSISKIIRKTKICQRWSVTCYLLVPINFNRLQMLWYQTTPKYNQRCSFKSGH